jgi:hypothetical protein
LGALPLFHRRHVVDEELLAECLFESVEGLRGRLVELTLQLVFHLLFGGKPVRKPVEVALSFGFQLLVVLGQTTHQDHQEPFDGGKYARGHHATGSPPGP